MNLRRVAVYAAVVLGTLALVYLVWVFRQALILFLFSLAIAAAARPYVDWVAGHGLRRTWALLIVYFLFIGLLLGLLMAVGTSLLRELQQVADSAVRWYDRLWTEWPEGTEIQQMIVQQLPAPADLYESFSPDSENSSLQGLFGFTALSAAFLGQLVTIIILSLYWGFDRVHFERLWLSLLPVESRARARTIWRNIEADFGAYIRSELLQSILASLLLGVGLWAMGVPFPTLLAIFGGLIWLIPWLGGVLAVAPITLVALAQGPGLAIFASAYAVGVLFFLEFFVEPRFIRRGQYSSLLSILFILALYEPFGLLGFLVAPPLAAATELIIRYSVQARAQPVGLEQVARISELKTRIENVRRQFAGDEEPLEPRTLNILDRLEELVERADQVIEAGRERPG
jgi:predicted PurR-regulated permease PerM